MIEIGFTRPEQPLVSVVIVTFGGWMALTRTLEALYANTPPCFEVVIVDNASPDGTGQRIREAVRGATLIFNDENLGFSKASNQGAEPGIGRFLCFLNSDALVQPGWLEPLVGTLEADQGAGAVVPLLLNENGTIQEAGSLVDSNGWAHAYGGGADAGVLEYRFRRDIDFGSAACLLLRREHFLEVDGFDEAYGIGYYEDVDLCFKLHERGLRTVFQPRSEVIHIRFGSGSPDQARVQMSDNRRLFLTRWGDRLAARPQAHDLSKGGPNLIATRDAEALDRLLVIDDRVPHFDRGSGDPRMANLVLEVARLWPRMRVTYLAADPSRAEDYSSALLDSGIEVVAGQDWDEWFHSRLFHYSIVLVSRAFNFESFHRLLRETQPQALLIFDLEALSFRRLHRLAEVQRAQSSDATRVEAARALEWETRAIKNADLVFCVSQEEADFANAVAPNTQAFLVPSFVELGDAPGFESRKDMLFFGGFLAGPASPNEDALLYLVSEVMPDIWSSEPDLVLNVIGADPTPAVRALDGDRVNVVGYVADPRRWLARARVHVHPMRFGAGIKLKLIETMAAGLPLVTTSVGAEGLGIEAAQPGLVCNEPRDVARQALRLYRDRAAWEATQEALLDLVRARFGRVAFDQTLAEALAHAGVEPPGRRAKSCHP